MARRVHESDDFSLFFHLIGTDMLRNPAGFFFHHGCFSDRIEQGRLSMIDSVANPE
jgi:hypothetical protein